MIAPRVRAVQSRLARRAEVGRGVGMTEAVAAAERAVETLRDDAMGSIADMLGDCEAQRAAAGTGEAAAFERLQLRAHELVGLAGTFGMPEIGRAALSLVRLFDAAAPALPNAKAVGVHLDALLMFRLLPPQALGAAAGQILEGLDKVVDKARRCAVAET